MPDTLRAGFIEAPAETWIPVLPQLCALAGQGEASGQAIVCGLLCHIASVAPQTVVFSAVAGASSVTADSVSFATFSKVLHEIGGHDKLLLKAAQVLAIEMKRVAVLWEEQWIDLLERRQVCLLLFLLCFRFI
jgi:hypothetical protein